MLCLMRGMKHIFDILFNYIIVNNRWKKVSTRYSS